MPFALNQIVVSVAVTWQPPCAPNSDASNALASSSSLLKSDEPM